MHLPPVATEIEAWVGSRFGLDIGEEKDLLPVLRTDQPKFLGWSVHSLGTILWSFCTNNVTYSQDICARALQLDVILHLPTLQIYKLTISKDVSSCNSCSLKIVVWLCIMMYAHLHLDGFSYDRAFSILLSVPISVSFVWHSHHFLIYIYCVYSSFPGNFQFYQSWTQNIWNAASYPWAILMLKFVIYSLCCICMSPCDCQLRSDRCLMPRALSDCVMKIPQRQFHYLRKRCMLPENLFMESKKRAKGIFV